MEEMDRFSRLCRDFAEQPPVPPTPVEELEVAAVRLRRRRRALGGSAAGLAVVSLLTLTAAQFSLGPSVLEVAARGFGDSSTEDVAATSSSSVAGGQRAVDSPTDSPSEGGAPADPGSDVTEPAPDGPPGEPEPPPTTTPEAPATTTTVPADSPRGWYGAEGCIATSENSSFDGGPYPPECTYVATQSGGYHANSFDDGPWEIRIERDDELIVYRSGESNVCTYLPVIKAGDRVTATTLVEGASSDRPADVSVGAAVSCSGRPPGDDPENDEGQSESQSSGQSDDENYESYEDQEDYKSYDDYREEYGEYEDRYRP